MSADGNEASREAEIRLLAEDLKIERKLVGGDTVHVRTVTTSAEHVVEDMLRHQKVEIQHVPVDREIDAMPGIRQEGHVTIVPVVKEVLVLQRRLVLVEEIHLRHVTVDEPFTTTVTLRQQQAEITRTPPAIEDPDASAADKGKV